MDPDFNLSVRFDPAKEASVRASLEALALRLLPFGHKSSIQAPTKGVLRMVVACEGSRPHVLRQLEDAANALRLQGWEAVAGPIEAAPAPPTGAGTAMSTAGATVATSVPPAP